jgi:hypothetical protein
MAQKNPNIVPDLTGLVLELDERQLEPADGAPIDLHAASLERVVFRFVILSGANLEGANLLGGDLAHSHLDGAELTGVNAGQVLLDHADLAAAHLSGAHLCRASLRFVNFSGADLEAADLSGSDLVHARLSGANLSGATLSKVRLDHADFDGADLTNANLAGASLHHVKNLLKGSSRAPEAAAPRSCRRSCKAKCPGRRGKTRPVWVTWTPRCLCRNRGREGGSISSTSPRMCAPCSLSALCLRSRSSVWVAFLGGSAVPEATIEQTRPMPVPDNTAPVSTTALLGAVATPPAEPSALPEKRQRSSLRRRRHLSIQALRKTGRRPLKHLKRRRSGHKTSRRTSQMPPPRYRCQFAPPFWLPRRRCSRAHGLSLAFMAPGLRRKKRPSAGLRLRRSRFAPGRRLMPLPLPKRLLALNGRPSAGRSLPPEAALSSLQPLLRRADALDAAPHALGHRAPCRRRSRTSCLSRLRSTRGGSNRS